MSFLTNIPTKEIIVNSDTQVRLLEDDGTTYTDGDVTPSAGGFILEGFLSLISGSELQLLAATTRIIAVAPVAGNPQIATYVLTATAAPADAIFRIVYDALDLTPTEYQNRPLEKRYQIPVQSTTDGIGAALVAAINADKRAPVTAGYVSGTDTLTLTGKNVGVKFTLYSVDVTLPTPTISQAATLPLNTYDALKNINWAKNFDIDQNINWMPLPGKTYKSYYFEVNGPVPAAVGSGPLPSQPQTSVRYAVRLYVATSGASTLTTALDLMVADVNV